MNNKSGLFFYTASEIRNNTVCSDSGFFLKFRAGNAEFYLSERNVSKGFCSYNKEINLG